MVDEMEIKTDGRKVITQQIMQNRAAKAKMLRKTYDDLVKLSKDESLPDSVRKVIRANVNSAYEALSRAERKFIAQVEKVVTSQFSRAHEVFELNQDKWIDDPTVTVLDNDDDE